jgi:hypothetical protein
MRHPFDGIIEPGAEQEAELPRRQVLRGAAVAGGAVVLGLNAAVLGQAATTMAVGEEGGAKAPPRKTTKAIGEEGGGRFPRPSTKMRGEEGGEGRPPMLDKQKLAADCVKKARKNLEEGKLGQAYDKLQLAAKLKPDETVKKEIVEVTGKLETASTAALGEADKQLKKGEVVEAVRTYQAVSKMKKLKAASAADEKLAAAGKHPDYADAVKEIAASDQYKQVVPLQKRLEKEKSGRLKTMYRQRIASVLKSIVKKYPATPTGKKSAKELADLKALDPKIDQPRPELPVATTMALGEEGSGRI